MGDRNTLRETNTLKSFNKHQRQPRPQQQSRPILGKSEEHKKVDECKLKDNTREQIYNKFPIDPQTGSLSEENFNILKKTMAGTNKESILRNAVNINDGQIEIGLNSTEMCILAIENSIIPLPTSKVLFTEANQERFLEKQSEFINNIKTEVEKLQLGGCIHICVGSTKENQEKPEEKLGRVADLCSYRNNNGVIDYFVYDPKGIPNVSSEETNLTEDLCKIIKGVIPKHNVNLSDKASMEEAISSKYFSIGAQLNVGNCAINVVNFVKSFEDQRNGENIENILNNKTEKAVILFETAIGTEEDTNMTMFYINNNSQKSKIKAIIGEEEKNEYCEVSINETGKSYYVPKERIKYEFVPEGINGISCNKLLMSVGVENVAIEEFLKQPTEKSDINIIITNATIDCYIDQEKLDIETLKQSDNNLSFLLVGIPVRKRKLSSAKNSQPSEIAKFSSSDEQLTATARQPEPKLQRTKNLPSYRKTLNMEYQREKLTQQQNNQTTQAKPRHTKSAPTRPVRQH